MNSYTGSDPIPRRNAVGARGEALLTLPCLTTQKEIDAHSVKLQRLNREGIDVWITLDSVTSQTRCWLNFAEHTFAQAETREAIQNRLRQWHSPSQAFERIYLIAQTNAESPCYDITDYTRRCVGGDLSIAERLRGRTIFRLYQTEIQADDLLSRKGVQALAHRVLKGYIHQFSGFIGRPVVGFCCELPAFLSPLRASPLSSPWSEELIDTVDTELLAYLPLICYETYDSATIRSLFWERLTQQFAKTCLGGLREFCHQWNLQLAVNVPATTKSLEIDIRAMLNAADRSIFSADPLDKPKQFLIAKLVTSRSRAAYSGKISMCRSESSPAREPSQIASDSVLGFNSWMTRVRHNAKPRFDGIQLHHLDRFLSIGVSKRSVLILAPTHSLWTKPDPKTW
ncbi:MAG: hypothetical protein O7E52_06365, partial [Candidatus Poribacteria bacterium]|nr:hypothetical protein [Candidatus Poribacteria bacterium]